MKWLAVMFLLAGCADCNINPGACGYNKPFVQNPGYLPAYPDIDWFKATSWSHPQ